MPLSMQIYNPGPRCKYVHESNYSEKFCIISEKSDFYFSRNPIFVFSKSLSKIRVAIVVGMAGGLEGWRATAALEPRYLNPLVFYAPAVGIAHMVCSVQCAACSV